MKSPVFIIAGALLLSACAPNQLIEKQKTEAQSMAAMHKAERKAARANKAELAAKATAGVAIQNANEAQRQADAAREDFYQTSCPDGLNK